MRIIRNTTVAFLILAFGLMGAFYLSARGNSDQLYKNAVINCERINTLRYESNARIAAHEADRDILIEFMKSAAHARYRSWQRTGAVGDLRAMRNYHHDITSERAQVTFHPLPIVNCPQVIKKP
jgi:uncharacterized protein YneF (UPF0154 family)